MQRRASRYFMQWLAFVTACCLAPPLALAQPTLRVLLEYETDPALDCPSASQLSADISGQLGYDPFTSDASEQRLRVGIIKVADGAEAQIEWIDRRRRSEGERRLASGGGDCADLARSLAFALAVQIQLHASAAAPAEAPSKEVVPPPRLAPKHPPPAPAPAKPQRLVLVGAGALLRHGFTPGVSPGLRVFGALLQEGWSLELSGHATLPSELQRPDGTGFTAHELAANVAPCVRLAIVGGCAVGTLNVLQVRGRGVDRVGTPASASGGVGARLQLIWPALERLGLVVQAESLVILGPRDVVLNEATVWSTAPFAFTAILDFAAIFK